MQKFEPIHTKINENDHYNAAHFGLTEKGGRKVANLINEDQDALIDQLTNAAFDVREKLLKMVIQLRKFEGKERERKIEEIINEVKKLSENAPCDLDHLSARIASNDFETVNEAIYYAFLFGKNIGEIVDRAKNEARELINGIQRDVDQLTGDDELDNDHEWGLPQEKKDKLNRELQDKYRSSDNLLNAPQLEIIEFSEKVLGLRRGDILNIKLKRFGAGIAFSIKLRDGVKVQ